MKQPSIASSGAPPAEESLGEKINDGFEEAELIWKDQYQEVLHQNSTLKVELKLSEQKKQRVEQKYEELKQKLAHVQELNEAFVKGAENQDAVKEMKNLLQKKDDTIEELWKRIAILQQELDNKEKVKMERKSSIVPIVDDAKVTALQEQYQQERERSDKFLVQVESLQKQLIEKTNEIEQLRAQVEVNHSYRQSQGEQEPSSADKNELQQQIYSLQVQLEQANQVMQNVQAEKEGIYKALQHEQDKLLEKGKDKLELEVRLNAAEGEAKKNQELRYNLEQELTQVKKSQCELLSKMKESQDLLDLCASFLQKNGLLSTSFLSEEENF